jgi:hypothetical protein
MNLTIMGCSTLRNRGRFTNLWPVNFNGRCSFGDQDVDGRVMDFEGMD